MYQTALYRTLAVGATIALFAPAVAQQQLNIQGQVIDHTTGEPLIGATVAVKAAKTGGVITDFDGKFAIRTNAELPVTLNVTFVGYDSQEVEVYDDSEPVTITLTENRNVLDQVVVIGYGTQKRSQLTASIASVNADNLKQPAPSVESALSGAVAGLNVSATSGQPGAASTIRIRGGNSITGGNEPLYVIDGFIIYNDQAATQTGVQNAEAHLDPLSFLNPSDIESIEVLKDVSATAIYGTRGANGVIMITTKKGKKGKTTINYTGNFSLGKISKKLKMMNAQQFVENYNEIQVNEGNPEKVLATPTESYDWQDAALQTAFTQEHQLSVVGGDDKSRFTISGSYKDQEGIIKGTDYTRFSGRVNYERDIRKWLKIGANANAAWSSQNGLNSGESHTNSSGSQWAPNSWIEALTTAPIIPIYNADGSYNYSPNVLTTVTFNGQVTNPISDLENVENRTENTRLIALAYAQVEPIRNLQIKGTVGTDLNYTRQKFYAPSYTTYGASRNGEARQGQNDYLTWQAELTANYNHTVAERHALSYLLGFTSQQTTRSGFWLSSYGFANDATSYNSLQSAQNTDATLSGSSASVSSLNSWLGRINYSFDERYNFTGTLRADGSSRFAKNNRWGWFPSAGFSWNLDREKWINLHHSFDFLRLRLSAGVVGNQEIGDYQFVANIKPGEYYFGGKQVTAYIIDNMASPELKWERTASYNVGIDAAWFNGRLNSTLDLYYKKTSDLLLDMPLQTVTGQTSVLKNAGSVSNKGIEFEVSGLLIDKRRVQWRASLNLAHNTNEITSLGDGVDYFLPSFEGVGTMTYLYPLIVKVGEPLGSFYGYQFEDIVQSGEDLSKYPSQATPTLEPGAPRYKDVNGDGVVNENDRTVLGNSQPKLTGGFSTSFSYYHWDFFLNTQFSLGNKLFNVTRCRYERTNLVWNSLESAVDRWTTTNPSHSIQKATSSTSIVTDDRFIEDASYLKVRNIQIGYTLPVRAISKDAKLRIYAGLQNFFTITGYSGFDPEANRSGKDETSGLYQGIDFGTYPSSRTVNVGLSLTL